LILSHVPSSTTILMSHIARYTENDCSLLRSKIRELHPFHRASLQALLQHLFRVASHSDKNAMTLEALAARFCDIILRGNAVWEGGVHAKKLVVEDLIQNAQILFEECPLLSSPVPSPHTTETTSIGAQAVSSTLRHLSGLVSDIPTSTQSSSSTSHSDSPVDGRLSSMPVPLPNPVLGLSSSQSRVETTTQEQDTSETLPTPISQPEDARTSLDDSEWWLPHPGLFPHPEEPTDPPSPPESVQSSTTEFSLSSTSLISSPNGSPPSPTASL